MEERKPPDPLRDLGDRLDKAQRDRKGAEPVDRGDSEPSRAALGLAFRIGVELVSALIVGVGIGWLIDRGLGTRPWGMIVFFFLGVAAGMWNVYRAVAGLGMAVGFRRDGTVSPPPQKKANWSDED